MLDAIVIYVPLMLGFSLVESYILLILIAGMMGFFIMGLAPILFQHSTEISYPVQEGVSMGLLMLTGQVSGTLFLLAIQSSSGTAVIPMLVLVALTVAEIPIIAKMKESQLLEESRAQRQLRS